MWRLLWFRKSINKKEVQTYRRLDRSSECWAGVVITLKWPLENKIVDFSIVDWKVSRLILTKWV